jgi:hypothetical protein
MKPRSLHFLPLCGFLAFAMAFAGQLDAQNLTLEGQTGGFITPTAYVVYTAKGAFLSHPAVGVHFVNTSKVIGNIETFSVLEGFANRAEIGYTRSVHQTGQETTGLDLSSLWQYNGMNIFNGKVVAVKEGQGAGWMPGVAVGGVLRTNDRFVSGALNQEFTGILKNYTNGDVYVAASKTRLKLPVPFLANVGWKATNASIFGIGGQSTRMSGRFFGGIGIPLPGPFHTAIVPAVGATQEPPQVKNLGAILVSGSAHLPTTLDYAVRVTQKDNPHFAADIGIGHVAGNIGSTVVPTGLPAPYPPYATLPIDLQATKVFGCGISFRY